MENVESLKIQIKETEKILQESAEYLKQNPDDYSAKLLYLSTENHLSDLLRKLDLAEMTQHISSKM